MTFTRNSSRSPIRRDRRPGNKISLATLLTAALALVCAGCRPAKVDVTYGRRTGNAAESVNGVSVLGEMFAQRGYKVSSWRRLSPRLNQADVIVWAPDDFQPPTVKQREFLEDWLWDDDSGRTLIYIGRDHDAAIDYWEATAAKAAPEDFAETQRQLAKARTAHDAKRTAAPADANARWFTLKNEGGKKKVAELSSPAGDWATGIDASKTKIAIEARMGIPAEPPTDDWAPLPNHEVLLESAGDPLVMRVTDPGWNESRIIVVANGSFLLNGGLVNREHRKLASRLIDECGDRQRVVFIESGPGEPEVFQREPGASGLNGLEAFRTWPMWPIVLQGAALGIVLCVALFPIFGRPRRLDRSSEADFGRHVFALGELLARGQDRDYAIARLDHYQQAVRRESGASHVKPRQGRKNSPFDASRPMSAAPTSAAPVVAAAPIAEKPASQGEPTQVVHGQAAPAKEADSSLQSVPSNNPPVTGN